MGKRTTENSEAGFEPTTTVTAALQAQDFVEPLDQQDSVIAHSEPIVDESTDIVAP